MTKLKPRTFKFQDIDGKQEEVAFKDIEDFYVDLIAGTYNIVVDGGEIVVNKSIYDTISKQLKQEINLLTHNKSSAKIQDEPVVTFFDSNETCVKVPLDNVLGLGAWGESNHSNYSFYIEIDDCINYTILKIAIDEDTYNYLLPIVNKQMQQGNKSKMHIKKNIKKD